MNVALILESDLLSLHCVLTSWKTGKPGGVHAPELSWTSAVLIMENEIGKTNKSVAIRLWLCVQTDFFKSHVLEQKSVKQEGGSGLEISKYR